MTLRILGAIFVIVGSGGFGFLTAATYRREERAMKHFISAMDYMECELRYRLTPLPELCRSAAAICNGSVNRVLITLADELDAQISPDVNKCIEVAVDNVCDIPSMTKEGFKLLGQTLGHFDLEGQLKGIETARDECKRKLALFMENQETRLRSYQTLALCAGAAIAILFI